MRKKIKNVIFIIIFSFIMPVFINSAETRKEYVDKIF